MMDKDTTLMETKEAAQFLGCAPGTLRNWVSEKRVPFIKVGRLVRFRRCDLTQWLDANLYMPASQQEEYWR